MDTHTRARQWDAHTHSHTQTHTHTHTSLLDVNPRLIEECEAVTERPYLQNKMSTCYVSFCCSVLSFVRLGSGRETTCLVFRDDCVCFLCHKHGWTMSRCLVKEYPVVSCLQVKLSVSDSGGTHGGKLSSRQKYSLLFSLTRLENVLVKISSGLMLTSV